MSVCRFALILVSAAVTLRAEVPSWSRHLSEAARLENVGELADAASEFASALRDARSAGPESVGVGTVLDAMGAFYDDIGNFNQAEACLEGSLRIWARGSGCRPRRPRPRGEPSRRGVPRRR
jgi:hypothetical protein